MLPSPLKLERLHRGLTQAVVAEAIGTDQTVISLLERGHRLSGAVFQRLVAYYDLFPRALHGRMLVWRTTTGAVPSRSSPQSATSRPEHGGSPAGTRVAVA